jgi:hypothetical protein
MPSNRQLDLAWLAGLIDGEGCFSTLYRHGKGGAASYTLRIVLESRDKFVLEKVQQIAGGRLQYRRPLKSWKPNWSDQWEWNLGKHDELYVLCQELLPFLVLKKDNCINTIKGLEEKPRLANLVMEYM